MDCIKGGLESDTSWKRSAEEYSYQIWSGQKSDDSPSTGGGRKFCGKRREEGGRPVENKPLHFQSDDDKRVHVSAERERKRGGLTCELDYKGGRRGPSRGSQGLLAFYYVERASGRQRQRPRGKRANANLPAIAKGGIGRFAVEPYLRSKNLVDALERDRGEIFGSWLGIWRRGKG